MDGDEWPAACCWDKPGRALRCARNCCWKAVGSSPAPGLAVSPRGCCLQLKGFVCPLFGTSVVPFGTVPSLATSHAAEKHRQHSPAFLILRLWFLYLGPEPCCWSTAEAIPSPNDV